MTKKTMPEPLIVTRSAGAVRNRQRQIYEIDANPDFLIWMEQARGTAQKPENKK